MNPERSPIGGETLRQAHKVDYLVDTGKITTTEASEASRREIDEMIEKIFNKNFTQNFYKPWEMRDKTMGQKAEDLLIELLNRFTHLHVNHGSERDDAQRKADMFLSVDDQGHEVPIQLATFTDKEKIQAKREKTPPDVLLVAVPMGDIFIAFEKHDLEGLKRVVETFARQVFEGLKKLPKYLPYFETLHEQLELVPV
jgi:hypothetical protein